MAETKKWRVDYDHKDGRHGTVEVSTEVGETGAFKYGNGKYGAIICDGFEQGYDLRYSNSKDLHRVILNEFFGEGLVKATEI